MQAPWLLPISLALLLLVGSPAIAGQSLTLGSGKRIEILEVARLQSTQGLSGLMLKYRTSVPLGELATLRKEADEIWQRFVVDVERGGYGLAIISANEPETDAVVTTNKSYGFVFEKRDGSWRTLESKERAQAKLDPEFMKEFMARLDWTYEHHALNAALLYMANDWTATVSTRIQMDQVRKFSTARNSTRSPMRRLLPPRRTSIIARSPRSPFQMQPWPRG